MKRYQRGGFSQGIASVLLTVVLSIASAQNHGLLHNNNVLVLIQPAVAGPYVPTDNYWNPDWILWPPSLERGSEGRLLLVSSGANWVGGPSIFRTQSLSQLKKQGYFEARKAMLGSIRTALLIGESGSAGTNALLLALNEDSPTVKPYSRHVPWPTDALMVAEASNWDEERAFRSSTSGRVLVAEYPPRFDVPWTRYWLDGGRWPAAPPPKLRNGAEFVPRQEDLPVPGLIRARLLIKLVTHPKDFKWVEVDPNAWPGANKFLEVDHSSGPAFAGFWMAFATLVSIWGAVVVVNERTSRALPVILLLLLLSPAIVDLSGLLGRFLGVGAWPVWTLVSTYVVLAISSVLRELQKRYVPKFHPLAAPFAVGLIVLCFVDPVWGFMSPVFDARTWAVSPVGIAALFGYLTGFVAFIQGSGARWKWIGRLACALIFVGGLAENAWWSRDLGATLAIPLFAWLIGENKFQWPMVLFLLVWPTSLVPLIRGGVVWAPAGLLINGNGLVGLNIFNHVEFLLSPSLSLFLPVAGGIALFGYRFFFHQMHALRQLDLRRNAVPTTAVAAAAFGVLHPIFLYASLTLAAGGLSTLLFDAVQTM